MSCSPFPTAGTTIRSTASRSFSVGSGAGNAGTAGSPPWLPSWYPWRVDSGVLKPAVSDDDERVEAAVRGREFASDVLVWSPILPQHD